jgi:hypothetical protein
MLVRIGWHEWTIATPSIYLERIGYDTGLPSAKSSKSGLFYTRKNNKYNTLEIITFTEKKYEVTRKGDAAMRRVG